jgi:glycerophosphoryl diester phosphodiesterase
MWPYPKLIAHRGGGTLAPENTIAAMRCALTHGYRGVEFDVMLARDLVPVVLHDTELGRTVKGSGPVAGLSAQELAALDAGSWFAPEFSGEGVPAYAEVFRFCLTHDLWMNVELKPTLGTEELTGHVVGVLTRQLLAEARLLFSQDPAKLPLFSSFSIAALAAAKKAAPEVPCAMLVKSLPKHWRELAQSLEVSAIDLNHANLDERKTAAVKKAGLGLFTYTVNDAARAQELFSWGVDGICTDRLDLLRP